MAMRYSVIFLISCHLIACGGSGSGSSVEATPTLSPTPALTPTPSPQPTISASPQPTASPTPTPTPTPIPSGERAVLHLDASDDLRYAPVLPQQTLYGERKVHGLNFGPFVEEGTAPGVTDLTESEITNLLSNIRPYTHWVRTYGVNNGQDKVGEIGHSMGIKVAMGVWLDSDLPSNSDQLNRAVELANAGEIDMVIVGNEVLLAGSLSEADLVAYIRQAKDALPGWQIACSEEIGALLHAAQWQAACDIWLVNVYPFWQGVNINDALKRMHEQYRQLVELAAGKQVIIGETGWPSDTDDRAGMGDALPNPGNAAYYFLNFVSWAEANNVEYFFFEAFDEPWKVELGFGNHWGIWDQYLNLKPSMELVFNGYVIDDNWSQ